MEAESVTATNAQVGIIMRERQKGRTQEQAAARANLKSRKTVAKYEQLGQLPGELKRTRTYRTWPDSFVEDWELVAGMLQDAPELEAKALFEWLCEQRPAQYNEGQLRTFQRRVTNWRGLNVPQVAILAQQRRPGEVLQTDGTWLTELGLTLNGAPFKHLLIHSVLPYSNWEWGRIAQSESLAAIRLGVQSTLLKLGRVPRYHQTDNSSAATRRLGITEAGGGSDGRAYTKGYQQLMAHFGMEARSTHVGNPNENGDIEASNGGLKAALAQHLLLRGSSDFADMTAYENFLFDVMERRNRRRQERLAEELAVMKPLTATPLTTSSIQRVAVSNGSLIRVLKNSYSVPTSLIGRQVTVHIHEWSIEVYYAGQRVEILPRLVGEQKHHVNYRHLIDTLLCKPGGFRDYRYRDDLFPTLVFRRAWEALNNRLSPRQADLTYLRVLRLAARTMESEVAVALELLLESGERWDERDVERLIQPDLPTPPALARGEVNLAVYDQLLGPGVNPPTRRDVSAPAEERCYAA
jgi:hypothetical protein